MNVEIGAYVLHALEEDEALALERHVAGCPQCQEELRDLEFTALSLLSLLSANESTLWQFDGRARTGTRDTHAVVPPASPTASGRSCPGCRGTRRRDVGSRPARSTTRHRRPTATVIQAADPATHVRASVSVAGQADGTRLHLSLVGAYPKGWCSLVAHSRDGRTDTAATWRAELGGTADVAGMTGIPAEDLSELDVVTDTGVVLVTIPIPKTQPPEPRPTDRRQHMRIAIPRPPAYRYRAALPLLTVAVLALAGCGSQRLRLVRWRAAARRAPAPSSPSATRAVTVCWSTRRAEPSMSATRRRARCCARVVPVARSGRR